MVALWASFLDQASGERLFAGLPMAFLRPVLEPLLRGEAPALRTPGLEVAPLSLPDARDRGLSDDRVRAAVASDVRHVMEIRRRLGGAPASEVLRDTDLLLDVDGEPLSRMSVLEALHGQDSATFTILRDGQEQEVEVATVPVDGRGTDRVLQWAGMILHESHFDVRAQQGIDPEGVYIAWLWYGSPAQRYGIRPTRRVVALDGTPTPDLDAFEAAVAGMADRASVRLTTEALDGSIRVQTLKLDLQYWPTQALKLEEGAWTRVTP